MSINIEYNNYLENFKYLKIYFFSLRLVRYICYVISFITTMSFNSYFYYKCRFCLKNDVKNFSFKFNTKNSNTDMNYNKGKIISWNIHYGYGYNEVFNLDRMCKLLEKENAEIYILQEVIKNDLINQELYIKNRLNIKNSYFVPDTKIYDVYQGNLILSRNPILEFKKYKLNQWYGHNNNNIIGIKTKINNKLTWVINVHFEGDFTLYHQENQLKELNKLINELKNECKEEKINFVVGGDFNIPQWSNIIKNTFKEMYICNDNQPTFPVYYPIVKLDYFISDYSNYTFNVLDSKLSDHKPISMVLN